MTTDPKILQHPNIPPPLHGRNPRTIMGQLWWDKTRLDVYDSNDFHCLACGVHRNEARYYSRLEAHENYTIDYCTGTVNIKNIIPLCHSCHNFIHSGRLYMISKTEDEIEKACEILKHGFNILEANNLDAYAGTLVVADRFGVEYNCEALKQKVPEIPIDWGSWKLLFNNQEYYSKFKDEKEWASFYSSK